VESENNANLQSCEICSSQ